MDEPMSSLKSMAEQAVLNAGLETHLPTSPSSSTERGKIYSLQTHD